jgi:hypothetical protein
VSISEEAIMDAKYDDAITALSAFVLQERR